MHVIYVCVRVRACVWNTELDCSSFKRWNVFTFVQSVGN